jgi:hypothetical protein
MNTAYVQPITRKVLATPALLFRPNVVSRLFVHGDAIRAPPPKPMMARPVAIPGRSGNHLISVDTGEM